jgi:hypothetical protein
MRIRNTVGKYLGKQGTVPCIYVVMDPRDDTLEDPLLGGDGDGVAGNKLCHLISGLRAVLPMPVAKNSAA